MADRYGIVHGRFQPFHVDHLRYVLAAYEKCDRLFVGITNPDQREISARHVDPNRFLDSSNPLTYWERMLLIRASLDEAGVRSERFCIVPFALDHPEQLHHYVPLTGCFFMTIYDDWGRHKRELLESLGAKVEVLWERDLAHKGVTATHVRRLICEQGQWEPLMPAAAVKEMKAMGLDKAIRERVSSGPGDQLANPTF